MKFFHLSDLHIGLILHNRSLYEDQKYILSQICDIAAKEKPDAVIIAGDIYDKAVPSAEAVELFDSFTEELVSAVPDAEIMMISGNHDSAPRLNIFRHILEHHRVHMIGMPPRTEDEHIETVTLHDKFGNINFYLLPFVKPSMVRNIVGTDENGNSLSYDESLRRLINREEINTDERNVLVSHQFYLPVGDNADNVERMDSEIRIAGNIDSVRADVLEKFDYAALGHIHKPMSVGSEFYRYCGTPLACSISEAGQQKGIIVVDMNEKGNVKTSVIPLSPLRQVRVIKGTAEEVLEQACDDYVKIILTDKNHENIFDNQDRIRFAFPHHIEIRPDYERENNYSAKVLSTEKLDPFELCMSFLSDLDEDEQELLKDVINTVREVQ